MAKPKKRWVRQMVSIDDLPVDLRDAVLRADGQPVVIRMPEYDKRYRPGRTDRQRKIL